MTTYRTTEGWEREIARATTAATRAVAKAEQRGAFTFGNHHDIRTAAARLRVIADRLDEIEATFPTPDSREDTP